MEAKLKKKFKEMGVMRELLHEISGLSFENACLIAAVLVLAAEVEGVKDEVRKLGDIVSTK